jgi:hypothetical protein
MDLQGLLQGQLFISTKQTNFKQNSHKGISFYKIRKPLGVAEQTET